MNNTVYMPVVWFATGVFYIMLNQSINYLKLIPSTMFQIQKVVTQTKIVMMKLIIIIIIIIIIKQEGIQHTKARLREVLKNKWKNKVMHGQYIRNIDRQLISEEDTFLLLSKGDLKAETESEIVAAQDQAIRTKYYATKILNKETDSKCRLCLQFDETIDHIIPARPILAKEQYIKRHDRVCAQLHFNICKETGVQLDKNTGTNMSQNQ